MLAALVVIGVVACVALAVNYRQPKPPPFIPVRVHPILFAESVTVRPDGAEDVVGASDVLLVPTLPAQVELTVVASLTPDRPRRSYFVSKLNPGSESSYGHSLILPVDAGVSGRPVTTVLKLPPFAVNHAEAGIKVPRRHVCSMAYAKNKRQRNRQLKAAAVAHGSG